MTTRDHGCRVASLFRGARRILAAGLVACALVLGAAGVSAADHFVLTADEANFRTEAGDVILIDVRSPQEWRQTGIPKGARRVTIHDPGGLEGFVKAMAAAVDGDLKKPVAVICARGNRSTLAQKVLSEAGFTRVFNIREGFIGGPFGPGWVKRGLPVEACPSC
ncbi:MAG: rhodanese-like domain-containing protein [Rhodospirillales bacterium]